MKEETHNPQTDPELEARIVARVLGEASDFERETLNQLIQERPELANFQERIQRVHGLLGDLEPNKSLADDSAWKLSADKRTSILALAADNETQPEAEPTVHRQPKQPTSSSPTSTWSLQRIAAMVCYITIPGILITLTFFSIRPALQTALSTSDSAITPSDGEMPSLAMTPSKSPNANQEHSNQSGKDSSSWFEGSPEADARKPSEQPRAIGTARYFNSKEAAENSEIGHLHSSARQTANPGSNRVKKRASSNSSRSRDRFTESQSQEKRVESENRFFGRGGASQSKEQQPQSAEPPNESKPFRPAAAATSGKATDRLDLLKRARNQEAVKRGESAPAFDLRQSGERYSAAEDSPSTNETDTEETEARPLVNQPAAPPLTPSSRTLFERGQIDEPASQLSDSGSPFIRSPDPSGNLDFKQRTKESGAGRKEGRLSNRRNTPATQPSQSQTRSAKTGLANKRKQPETANGADLSLNSAQQNHLGLESSQLVELDKNIGGFDGLSQQPEVTNRRNEFRQIQQADEGLNEKNTEQEAFSTFSLHVSDVSFKLAQSALARGEWPAAETVRIEEFVNAFDYGDPTPGRSEKVSCCVEQSIHPFLQQRNLLRISMKTAAEGRSNDTPLRLTLLLDNSGSMERLDRRQTVRRAFALLAQQLKPIDQVTLISFARQPRLLADKVSGTESQQLLQLIQDLPSEGGTNIEAALALAFEKALEQRLEGAQNRIVLLTDGAVNLGDANPDSLSQMLARMRDQGIAFDAAGISAEGLNDEILEALTRRSDGRYYLLDSLEAADAGFARQIAGALRPAAQNVKVQIEFNPQRVGHYKLLGFEKHRLQQEDFHDDNVDAAEMAAAEAGVAIYQFEPKADGEGDVGSVSVRFRDLSTGQMIENRWPIPYDANAPRFDRANPALRIAGSAALLAAKLKGTALGETVELKALSDVLAGLPTRYRDAKRLQQLQQMIQQARQMSGK
ncbi:MAG: von Willebrand factor type A domain-containing protein [Pirellulaceae bacterium]|nr:von Willebrand factor type A domain-containing protein [Pirellulaceae bacterium]